MSKKSGPLDREKSPSTKQCPKLCGLHAGAFDEHNWYKKRRKVPLSSRQENWKNGG
jgi:hypothetical protein